MSTPEDKPKPKPRKKKDAPTPAEVEKTAGERAAESKPAPKEDKGAEADKPKPAAKAKKAKAEKTSDDAKAGAQKADDAEKKPAAKPKAAAKKPKAEKAGDSGAEAASEKPATAKPKPPARRRDQPRRREPGEAPVVVRAQARYVRTSARKARLVCDHIRGKDVEQARAILSFTPRDAAKAWMKLLESAIANAEHNHELVGDELKIHSVHADEGPTLKRFRPRAMGRATRIRKRTSHLTITLTPKE